MVRARAAVYRLRTLWRPTAKPLLIGFTGRTAGKQRSCYCSENPHKAFVKGSLETILNVLKKRIRVRQTREYEVYV